MRRKKNDEIPKNDFDVNESQDLLSFDRKADLGECVATFSFSNSSDSDLNNASDDLSININKISNTEE